MPRKTPEARREYENSPARKASAKAWRERNRARVLGYYRAHYKRQKEDGRNTEHGVTLAEQLAAMEMQAGLCQICTEPLVMKRGFKNSAHTDHCRETKKFRGMLCSRCNMGLGLFRHDPLLLQGAGPYLEKAS